MAKDAQRDEFYQWSIDNGLVWVEDKGCMHRDVVKTIAMLKGTKWEHRNKYLMGDT